MFRQTYGLLLELSGLWRETLKEIRVKVVKSNTTQDGEVKKDG